MNLRRVFPLLLLLLVCAACRRSQDVPAELSGTWQTEEARYKDKYLKFEESYVTVSVGEDQLPKVELILHIEARREGPGTTYVIDARDQSGIHDRITVLYSPQNGGELRMANPRQVVWKKAAQAN